ncbi:hypothetical protein MACK_001683 [Theileria orientalis]|uniref:Uncharacterized protein n=1 Tax=Theileria orientalis TaxID=68886 RepID=A0A976MES2_THEOR|nr:hypothetical protein MACK_001683 [Theileria orientalis]
MNFLKLTRVNLSRLYNSRFKTKIGFFSPSKTFNETRTDYSKLIIQNHIDSTGKLSKGNVINYGIFFPNEGLKLDLLHQSLSHIFNKWPNYKVCIYANGYRANQILKSSKIKGGKILLLSDGIITKIPNIDLIIHYDLPNTLEIFVKRMAARKVNLFFYGRTGKLYMAQLQNYLNVVVHEWPMPSNQSIVDSFLNQIDQNFKSKFEESQEKKESSLDKTYTYECSDRRIIDTLISKEGSGLGNKFDEKSVLASLLYMLHYKYKSVKKKQYLVYDPKFKVFKSRESVMNYLNENGVVYNSVNICKNGYIIESLNEVSLSGLTPVVKYKKFTSHINKVKRLIKRSYISSPITRRKYFKKLVKEHERKIINKLKSI